MITIADLVARLRLDATQFGPGIAQVGQQIRQAQAALAGLGQQAGQAGQAVSAATTSLNQAQASLNAVASAATKAAAAKNQAATASSALTHNLGTLRTTAQRTFEVFAGVKLSQIFDLAGEGIRKMVGFMIKSSQEIENQRLGIASIVNATADIADSTGRILQGQEKWNAAIKISEDLYRDLRAAAVATTLPIEDMTFAFNQAFAPGSAAGLGAKEILDVVTNISAAWRSQGRPAYLVAQEVRAIMRGTIDRNAELAQALQITNKQIQAAKDEGRFYEFLIQKLGAYKFTLVDIQATWTGIMTALKNAAQLLSADIFRPTFDMLKSRMTELRNFLITPQGVIRPEAAKAFEGLGQMIQRVTTFLVDFGTNAAKAFTDPSSSLSKFIEQIKELIFSLGKLMTHLAELGTWLTSRLTPLVTDAISAFNSMPEVMKEVGLVGAVLFGGVKGLVILGLAMALFERLHNSISAVAGGMPVGDWIFSNSEDTKAYLDDPAGYMAKRMRDIENIRSLRRRQAELFGDVNFPGVGPGGGAPEVLRDTLRRQEARQRAFGAFPEAPGMAGEAFSIVPRLAGPDAENEKALEDAKNFIKQLEGQLVGPFMRRIEEMNIEWAKIEKKMFPKEPERAALRARSEALREAVKELGMTQEMMDLSRAKFDLPADRGGIGFEQRIADLQQGYDTLMRLAVNFESDVALQKAQKVMGEIIALRRQFNLQPMLADLGRVNAGILSGISMTVEESRNAHERQRISFQELMDFEVQAVEESYAAQLAAARKKYRLTTSEGANATEINTAQMTRESEVNEAKTQRAIALEKLRLQNLIFVFNEEKAIRQRAFDAEIAMIERLKAENEHRYDTQIRAVQFANEIAVETNKASIDSQLDAITQVAELQRRKLEEQTGNQRREIQARRTLIEQENTFGVTLTEQGKTLIAGIEHEITRSKETETRARENIDRDEFENRMKLLSKLSLEEQALAKSTSNELATRFGAFIDETTSAQITKLQGQIKNIQFMLNAGIGGDPASLGALLLNKQKQLVGLQLTDAIEKGNIWDTVKLTMAKAFEDMGNIAQAFSDLVLDVFSNLQRSLSDTFFAVLKGDIESLEDVFKSFLNSLLRAISDFLAQAVLNEFKNLGLQIMQGISAGGGGGSALGTGLSWLWKGISGLSSAGAFDIGTSTASVGIDVAGGAADVGSIIMPQMQKGAVTVGQKMSEGFQQELPDVSRQFGLTIKQHMMEGGAAAADAARDVVGEGVTAAVTDPDKARAINDAVGKAIGFGFAGAIAQGFGLAGTLGLGSVKVVAAYESWQNFFNEFNEGGRFSFGTPSHAMSPATRAAFDSQREGERNPFGGAPFGGPDLGDIGNAGESTGSDFGGGGISNEQRRRRAALDIDPQAARTFAAITEKELVKVFENKDFQQALASTVSGAIATGLAAENAEEGFSAFKAALSNSVIDAIISGLAQGAVFQAAAAPLVAAITEAFNRGLTGDAFRAAIAPAIAQFGANIEALRPAFEDVFGVVQDVRTIMGDNVQASQDTLDRWLGLVTPVEEVAKASEDIEKTRATTLIVEEVMAGTLSEQTIAMLEQLGIAGDLLETLRAAGEVEIPGLSPTPDGAPPEPPGHLRGGWIPGVTLGRDHVPAMLDAGEFVVNSRAARAHRPLLEGINRTGFLSGGNVFPITGYGSPGRFNIQSEEAEGLVDVLMEVAASIRKLLIESGDLVNAFNSLGLEISVLEDRGRKAYAALLASEDLEEATENAAKLQSIIEERYNLELDAAQELADEVERLSDIFAKGVGAAARLKVVNRETIDWAVGLIRTVPSVNAQVSGLVSLMESLASSGKAGEGLNAIEMLPDILSKIFTSLKPDEQVEAVQALSDAFDSMHESAEDAAKTWREVVQNVGRQITDLRLSNAGPTNPFTQLTSAQAAFHASLSAFSAAPTPEAAANVQELAGKVLEFAAEVFTRPDPRYQTIFEEVTGGLTSIQNVAQEQVSEAEQIIAAIETHIPTLQAAMTTALTNLSLQQQAAVDALNILTGGTPFEEWQKLKQQEMVDVLYLVHEAVAKLVGGLPDYSVQPQTAEEIATKAYEFLKGLLASGGGNLEKALGTATTADAVAKLTAAGLPIPTIQWITDALAGKVAIDWSVVATYLKALGIPSAQEGMHTGGYEGPVWVHPNEVIGSEEEWSEGGDQITVNVTINGAQSPREVVRELDRYFRTGPGAKIVKRRLKGGGPS